MAFIVEDGTGIIDANAYIDLAFVSAYFLERNDLVWSGTDAEKQAFIIKATDYIDLIFWKRFLGTVFSESQALKFPRLADDGVSAKPIPLNLKRACAEYAKIAKSQALLVNPTLPTDGLVVSQIDKEVAGAVKKNIKYDTNKSFIAIRPYPSADYYLSSLLIPNSNFILRN